jgi:hypothetical protein
VIVGTAVEPFELLCPLKVTLEQATKFALSLARGEPNRELIALTVLTDKVRELIGGCDEFRGFSGAHAAWADTGLSRSAKPGGPARSGCQWDGAPLLFRPASGGETIESLR